MTIRPRVLFVDDESNLLETVQDLLHREYEVVTTTSPREALELAARGDIAIVVSDLRMPEVDGISLLRQVRERAPTTIRLLLTGHADLDAAVRAVNQGAIFRLLIKPCPPDELRTALRDAVEQRRMLHADHELLAARITELSSRLLHAERLATLGTMTAAMSHELNNAIAVMHSTIGYVREIYEGGLQVDAEVVMLLERGEQRLRRHAQGVLNLARTDTSAPTRVDLGELAKSVVTLLRDLGLGTRVIVGLAAAPDAVVDAKRSEIEQVLINLVKNAVEAIEDSGRRAGKVMVEVRAGDPVEIVITDDGCGIPADRLEKIFEPFFTTKAAGRGTGLGLPVVRQIVEAHHGTIAVDSATGAGTTFTIRLPAARAEAPATAA